MRRLIGITGMALLLLSGDLGALPFTLDAESESANGEADISATHAYNRGIEALNNRNLDAAEAAFGEAHEIEPRALEPLLGLAEVAQLRGDRGQTESQLTRALNVAPADVRARTAWARWLYATQRYEEAIAAFEQLLSEQPDRFVTRVDLADTLMAASRHGDAETHYRRALDIEPQRAGVRFALGQSLRAQLKFDESEAAYTAAIESEGKNPLPHLARGQLRLDTGRPDAALGDFNKALELNNKFVAAKLGKAEALIALYRNPEATSLLEATLKDDADNIDIHRLLARVYESDNKIFDALKAYTKVVAAAAGDVEAAMKMAQLSLSTNTNIDATVPALENVLMLRPESAEARELLAEAYVRTGQVDAGLGLAKMMGAESIYRKFDQRVELSFAYGTLLLSQNRGPEAAERFEFVVEHDKDSALHDLALGHITFSSGKFDDAVAAFEKGMTAAHTDAVTLTHYSDALLATKEYERALALIEEAIALAPDDADCLFKQAVLLQITGRYGAAISAYHEFVDADPTRAAISLNNMAWMSAERSQNLDQAVGWARQAIKYEPESAAYHDTLGWVYFRTGDLDQAREAFDKALSFDINYEAAKSHKAMVEELAADGTETAPAPGAG